jgi:hypothetical protein
MERLGPLCRQPYTGTVREPIFSPLPGSACALFRRAHAVSDVPSPSDEGRPPSIACAALRKSRSTGPAATRRAGGTHDGGRRRAEPSGRQPDGRDQLECSDGAKAAGTGASVNSQSSRGRRHGVLLVLASLARSWRPWPAVAGGAGARPDHPVGGPLLRERRAPYNIDLGALTLLECPRCTRRDGGQRVLFEIARARARPMQS